MTNDRTLGDYLVAQLDSAYAHAGFAQAVAKWPPKLRGLRAEGSPHSAWELLEHLRIAQWDILEFSRNPEHVSPQFPDGYWPPDLAPSSDRAWEESIRQFLRDLQSMQNLVSAPHADLFARFPNGEGQTLVKEALTLASHNSYHIGQLMLLRRIVGIS